VIGGIAGWKSRAAAYAVLAMAACRGPAAPESSTVTASRADTATAATAVEDTPEARSRARAIALARFASGDEPVYPEMSRRLQEEGTVELSIGLLGDGSVHDLGIARSSGHRRLDDAALVAARTWRFNPRTGGADIETIRYRVVFQLVD
jgi:TonB family protein